MKREAINFITDTPVSNFSLGTYRIIADNAVIHLQQSATQGFKPVGTIAGTGFIIELTQNDLIKAVFASGTASIVQID